MNYLRIIFVTIFIFTSCAEVKNVKKNLLGVNSSSSFEKIKSGMNNKEMLKVMKDEKPKSFEINPAKILYGFEDGFVVTRSEKVEEAYEYRTIAPDQTLSDLVTLNMHTIDVFKNAGWPLEIKTKGDAHVFYYRTGTLLIKENELLNFFNRSERYSVIVSAFRGIKIQNPSYYLMPSVPGIDRNSPEFLEVKEYISQLLDEEGNVTDSLESANVILFVNFGVGDKNVDLLSYSTPVYRSVWNPGSTSTTQVQDQYGKDVGTIKSSTPSSVTSEYIGNISSQVRVESYRLHLILEAVDALVYKANGERKYFWKTTVQSIGTDPDFRAILPVLTFATHGYIFKNSGKAVQVQINFEQMMDYFLKVFSK